MDRTNFFNGQHVVSDDLNAVDTTKALAVKQALAAVLAKFTHTQQGTIPADFRQSVADASLSLVTFRGVGGGLGSDYLTPLNASSSQITVQRGWAVTDGMDVLIIPSTVTVNKGDDTLHGTWVSTTGSPMYVVAEYQEVSSSVGVTPAGVTVYTRYADDYKIRVTSVAPTASTQIPLATFTSDGSGLISSATFVDVREYIRTHAADTSVGLTGTAVFSGQTTLYDHIHSTGSGTPRARNPHGVTLDDLDYIDSTGIHRRDSHVSGIMIGPNYNSTSYAGTVTTGGSDDYITFATPVDATLAIDGRIITGGIPLPLYASSANNGPDDYWVIVNSSLAASFISTSAMTFNPRIPQANSQSVLLASATVNPTAKTITNYQDRRTFYTMSQPEIRADFVEGVSSASVTLNQYATLQDNLDRLRYQVGMALRGTGSVWNSTIYPLTSGSLSTADAYHRHTLPSASIPLQVTATKGVWYQNKSGSIIEVSIPVQCETTAVGGSSASAFLYVSSDTTAPRTADQLILTIGVQASLNGVLRTFVTQGEYWSIDSATTNGTTTFGVPVLRIFPSFTGRSGTGSI